MSNNGHFDQRDVPILPHHQMVIIVSLWHSTNVSLPHRARNNGQTPDNVWPYIEMSGRNNFHQCN